MSEITLEKIDLIRERLGVTYGEAKEALEATDGNIVDALIYLENNKKSNIENIYNSKDEFINWVKDVVNKGNVTRIKIKRDDKVIVDIPVNAGVAAGIFMLIWPPIMGISLITAVALKLTVEITRDDGSVEIVNTIIRDTVNDVKEKVSEVASEVKDKIRTKKNDEQPSEENVYRYTVKFEDIENPSEKEENK